VQRRADLLFLPLAFDSPYPVLINTSCPSKMGEYLASGRPVLVHAPAGSFVAWYFKKYECGLVVDEPDPAKLAAAVGRLLTDNDLRRRLGHRARERARADFSVPVARATFEGLMRSGGYAPAPAPPRVA
jgi:glycosyltransferase involved in cell wall biosynthesis